MKQLLLECSEPGVVVALEEELENILRRVDFKKAQEIQEKLLHLSQKLGPDYEDLWRGFRMEVSNDLCASPPSFGKRERAPKKKLNELLLQAKREEIGSFKVYSTLLLSQGGPTPETREQYIEDLANSISFSSHYMCPINNNHLGFPKKIAAYRLRLLKEHLDCVLKQAATSTSTGPKWLKDSKDKIDTSLTEINTKAHAIMEYELFQLDPDKLDLQERIQWASLSCSIGKDYKKWCRAALKEIDYLYQRAALLLHLCSICENMGRAADFLREKFQEIIEESKSIYTEDGSQALEILYKKCENPWNKMRNLLKDKEEEDW